MKEERFEGVVRIEPITNENGDKRVLPGAKKTYAPVLDRYGNISCGFSKEEIAEYEAALGNDLNDKFWATYRVVMTDTPRVFDLAVPEQRMAVTFLRRHPDILDIGDSKNPRNIYKVIDEEFIANREAVNLDYKEKGYSYLKDMEKEDLAGFLLLFGVKGTEKSSLNVLKKKGSELLEDDSKKFCEVYEDNNKSTRILLKELTKYAVLRMNKTHYFHGEVHVGVNEELAIEFLKDNENQQVLIALKKELEEKKKVS
jgi:hypothetical protein